jgi:flagellar biosynthesis protein FlhF
VPPQTFIADSAADALTQIRAQLGPDAVVLNVRQVAGPGIARLWQKPRIEVVAHVPEAPAPPVPAPTPPPALAPERPGLDELRRELAEIRDRMDLERRLAAAQVARETPRPSPVPIAPQSAPAPARIREARPAVARAPTAAGWRVGGLLEQAGLNRVHVQRIEDELEEQFGPTAPPELPEELALAQQVLGGFWRPAPPLAEGHQRPHVFLGSPGSGKTTLLCKWLAQSVLLEGRTAHVWRLDGSTANTAEALSVYGEILGVPVVRFWRGAEESEGADLTFIDLPGFNPRDEHAVTAVRGLLANVTGAQLHLVVNAAYEIPLLLGQIRGLSQFGEADLCVTHLDEEPRWGKLWNLALGTNLPLRFLSAGQNIPGDLFAASAEKIFSRQFSGI